MAMFHEALIYKSICGRLVCKTRVVLYENLISLMIPENYKHRHIKNVVHIIIVLKYR